MRQTIKKESILRGISTSNYFSQQGQFQNSIGIDPDMPVTDSGTRPCGLIRPTSMAKFSVTEVTGVPLWMISNPKDTNCYVYANDGKCHVVNSSLAMGTALNSGTALTSSSANGSAYYDNYLYLAKNTDIARYGPLNGSPTLVENYWTTTLSLTAPTNTTYPSINGVVMPNHTCFRHTNNVLYFCDVTSGNIGILNAIKTTKTTVEGDTNNVSAYNVIDFNYGWYPTAICNWEKYVLVALIEGTSTTVNQKPAKLILWDTISSSFEDVTPDNFSDPLITALRNINGTVYVWSGNATGGCRLSRFVAVQTLDCLAYIPDAYPPLAGAVDQFLTRIVWGSKITTPAVAGVVYSYNSLYPEFSGIEKVQCILKSSATGANPYVTCLKYFAQSPAMPQPLIGYDDDSTKGLDKVSTTYDTSYFVDEMIRVGRPFKVERIIIPLASAIVSGNTLTVKIYFDDGSSNLTLPVINNTNYSGQRNIDFKPQNAIGKNNFYIELSWSGTVLLTVGLPLVYEISIISD